jgi:hypothetical protein
VLRFGLDGVDELGAERTVTDTNAVGNARFYRIQITYP